MGKQSEPKSSTLRWALHLLLISQCLMPFLPFLGISIHSFSFRIGAVHSHQMAATTCLIDKTDSISMKLYSVASITMTGYMMIHNWDVYQVPHYTFELFTEIYVFPITLSCWQFVEILQWYNHFLNALPLVYLRKLVSVYSCWLSYFGMIWESFRIKAQLKCHLWDVLRSCS